MTNSSASERKSLISVNIQDYTAFSKSPHYALQCVKKHPKKLVENADCVLPPESRCSKSGVGSVTVFFKPLDPPEGSILINSGLEEQGL